jgi:hypothetical protein
MDTVFFVCMAVLPLAILGYQLNGHHRLRRWADSQGAGGATVRFWTAPIGMPRLAQALILAFTALAMLAVLVLGALALSRGETPIGISSVAVLGVVLFSPGFDRLFAPGTVAFTEERLYSLVLRREYRWDELERMVYSDGKTVYRLVKGNQVILGGRPDSFAGDWWKTVNQRLANDLFSPDRS